MKIDGQKEGRSVIKGVLFQKTTPKKSPKRNPHTIFTIVYGRNPGKVWMESLTLKGSMRSG